MPLLLLLLLLLCSFYVTPQCAQSRAALLTGRYPPRAGEPGMPPACRWDFFVTAGEAPGLACTLGSNRITEQNCVNYKSAKKHWFNVLFNTD